VAEAKVPVFASQGLILLHLAREPESTMREMALVFGLTERRVAEIIKSLVECEMVTVSKVGKRNFYSVNQSSSCFHPSLPGLTVGDLIRVTGTIGQKQSPPERRATSDLMPAFLLPLTATDSEFIAGLLPALLPLLG
jgi:hypothetical protein